MHNISIYFLVLFHKGNIYILNQGIYFCDIAQYTMVFLVVKKKRETALKIFLGVSLETKAC